MKALPRLGDSWENNNKKKLEKNAPWFNIYDGKGKCENVYSIKIQGLQSYEATSEDS